jgi:hypothetical protein
MKTITTKKQVCNLTKDKETLIYVDGTLVVKLTSINGKKSGYDSRVKFSVFNYANDLGLSYWSRTARSIKQVTEYINK